MTVRDSRKCLSLIGISFFDLCKDKKIRIAPFGRKYIIQIVKAALIFHFGTKNRIYRFVNVYFNFICTTPSVNTHQF